MATHLSDNTAHGLTAVIARLVALEGTTPGGASSVYKGPYSNLSADQRAVLDMGDYVLLNNRFWIVHLRALARLNSPGSGANDGWRPIDGQYRGNATTLARFYDAGDHTVVGGILFFCETEGSYTADEIPTSNAWSGGGLNATSVEGRIDQHIVNRTPSQMLVAATAAQYNAGTIASLGAHSYYVKRTGHTATPDKWTWADLDTTYLLGYRGVTGQNPASEIDNPILNDWSYDRVGRSWNRYIGLWAHTAAPANFDAHYATEAAAQRGGVTGVGQFIYDVDTRKVRVIAGYTGATPSNLTFEWAAQNPGDGGQSTPATPAASGLPTVMVGENSGLALTTNVWADSGIAMPTTDYFWIEIFIGALGGVLNLHRTANFSGTATVGQAPASSNRVRGDVRAGIQHNFGRLSNGNLAVSAGTAASYGMRVWR